MREKMIDQAKAELEAAQLALDAALRAWDASVSELWRTSVVLTQAQKRVTHAYELLRSSLGTLEVDMH
jgi:exonuclease VII small subunit